MTESYPLHWPDGWPRTDAYDRRAELQSGGRRMHWEETVDRLFRNLEMMGAADIILSTNQELRRDGLPYATRRLVGDPGAAVYFVRDGRQLVMAQDRYARLVDNIRSLALAIEGLRQMDRHGGGVMLERAFTGFAAIEDHSADDWRAVLELQQRPYADITRRDIQAAFRRLALAVHPDHDGDAEQMRRLIEARDAGLKELEKAA